MTSRKEQLEALLADDPNDTFLLYGLAMELRKESSFEEAKQHFDKLMASKPPYVPAFFMCGQMFAEQGKIDQARDVLRIGIDHARAQQNDHAAGEMAELLTSLGNLGE